MRGCSCKMVLGSFKHPSLSNPILKSSERSLPPLPSFPEASQKQTTKMNSPPHSDFSCFPPSPNHFPTFRVFSVVCACPHNFKMSPPKRKIAPLPASPFFLKVFLFFSSFFPAFLLFLPPSLNFPISSFLMSFASSEDVWPCRMIGCGGRH